MTDTVFLFKNIQARGLQVGSGFCVGFPAITAFTGAAEAFCLKLADKLSLPRKSFQSEGVLVSFEHYQFIDAYRKNRKPGENVYEQVVQAFANATLHLAFSVKATSDKAAEALEAGVAREAAEVLSSMQLAKARLENVRAPKRFKTAEEALATLPANAWVVEDASFLVQDMRSEGLDLLEGLACATLRPAQRPAAWKAFFDSRMTRSASKEAGEVEDGAAVVVPWKLGAVQTGFMQVDEVGLSKGVRADEQGALPTAYVASPVLGLVRFQKAASVRLTCKEDGLTPPVWRLTQPQPGIWTCTI